jgi:hypothetical protein
LLEFAQYIVNVSLEGSPRDYEHRMSQGEEPDSQGVGLWWRLAGKEIHFYTFWILRCENIKVKKSKNKHIAVCGSTSL